MRIINVLADPRHYSYNTRTGDGRTLKPGESGPEVPMSVLHLEQFRTDLKAGKIQLRLSPEDRAYLEHILAEDKRAIVVKTKPKPVAVPKPVKPSKPAVLKPQVTAAPVEPEVEVAPMDIEQVKAGKASLQDLIRQNRMGVPPLDQIGAGNGKIVMDGVPRFDGKKIELHGIQGFMRGIV